VRVYNEGVRSIADLYECHDEWLVRHVARVVVAESQGFTCAGLRALVALHGVHVPGNVPPHVLEQECSFVLNMPPAIRSDGVRLLSDMRSSCLINTVESFMLRLIVQLDWSSAEVVADSALKWCDRLAGRALGVLSRACLGALCFLTLNDLPCTGAQKVADKVGSVLLAIGMMALMELVAESPEAAQHLHALLHPPALRTHTSLPHLLSPSVLTPLSLLLTTVHSLACAGTAIHLNSSFPTPPERDTPIDTSRPPPYAPEEVEECAAAMWANEWEVSDSGLALDAAAAAPSPHRGGGGHAPSPYVGLPPQMWANEWEVSASGLGLDASAAAACGGREEGCHALPHQERLDGITEAARLCLSASQGTAASATQGRGGVTLWGGGGADVRRDADADEDAADAAAESEADAAAAAAAAHRVIQDTLAALAQFPLAAEYDGGGGGEGRGGGGGVYGVMLADAVVRVDLLLGHVLMDVWRDPGARSVCVVGGGHTLGRGGSVGACPREKPWVQACMTRVLNKLVVGRGGGSQGGEDERGKRRCSVYLLYQYIRTNTDI
jgi:hypothetical protein